MTYTKQLRENYTPEQHAKIIDVSLGFLKKEEVVEEIRTLFDESGLEQYLIGQQQLWQHLRTSNRPDIVQKKITMVNIEIQKLLQLPLYYKEPLSYKHIAYDDFKIGVNHKFVIFLDYTGAVGEKNVVLLTGTGATQHRDHLSAFLEHHEGSTKFNSSLVGLDNLGGGRVKKTQEGIHPHSISLGLGGTSEVTRKIIFETLFPNEQVIFEV